MSDTVIRVEDLGKRYRIGATRATARTRREALVRALGVPFRHLRTMLGKPRPEEVLWAIRHISLEVNRGEVLGVIGRNGAGKSTLLKVLSRITEPTEGMADIYGRVGSLLEVGTGFHPELTGRENVYLSGAILGMKKSEIDRQFDQIVAFADVARFIDTPVKRYSSGMYVRLAFAVAAHLQSDILLVDEVLAVGDVAFQQKCLGKMGEVARVGRTVLFVSHNLEAIRTLCTRCLYLDGGQVKDLGDPVPVVDAFHRESLPQGRLRPNSLDQFRVEQSATAPAKLGAVWIDEHPGSIPDVATGSAFTLRLFVQCDRPLKHVNVALILKHAQGTTLTSILAHDTCEGLDLNEGGNVVSCRFPELRLVPGDYFLDVGITAVPDRPVWDLLRGYPVFRAVNLGDKRLRFWMSRPGSIVVDNVDWDVTPCDGPPACPDTPAQE